ncbi:MAG: hypothetical protein IJ752_03090 [Alphaproteobacteria bacterium]|nr:hypothetical protein [Alphaproteobacteria bacterium]
MTVSTTTNKISYIGNGTATEFAIPFPFLAQDHLKVYQRLNDMQTERTDWAISDGNLVFETAPADGAQIVIMREVPLTQETDYRENEAMPAETLERNFDRLTMQVQQLSEKQDRALLLDVFSDDDPNEFVKNFKNAVAEAQNAAQEAGDQSQAAMEQADRAKAAADRTDWVDLDSEQTITAIKTLNTDTDDFSGSVYAPFIDFSVNSELCARIAGGKQTNGTNSSAILQAWNNGANAALSANVFKDGTKYGIAPTPTDISTAPSTAIVTLAVLAGQNCFKNIVVGNNTGYIEFFGNKEKNSRIALLQWGYGSSAVTTVTFPKAFSNTKFLALAAGTAPSATTGAATYFSTFNYTTTTMSIARSSSGAVFGWVAFGK